ncbi:MAG: twin-arginine translocation signal domain-containing protein, partial [Gemmatimonadota bacterium]|nr:twin-arginine translocation signal domain-containing protein [Gemmatimonadota bacterium]
MAVTRREFVAGAGAALAAGSLTGFPAIAQVRPLKVGVFVSEVDTQGIDELVEPYVFQMRL